MLFFIFSVEIHADIILAVQMSTHRLQTTYTYSYFLNYSALKQPVSCISALMFRFLRQIPTQSRTGRNYEINSARLLYLYVALRHGSGRFFTLINTDASHK